jgi:hypothetical protein
MNDETNAPDTAADDQAVDQAPAAQHDHDVEPAGDAPPAFDASDADWEAAGVQPDEAPNGPDGYGLVGSGDPEVDAVLEGMAMNGDPVLDQFASVAHQLGLSHQQFAALAQWYVGQHVHNAVTWDQAGEALSPNADKMLEQIDRWGQVHLSARTQALIKQAQPSPALLAVLSDAMLATGHLAPDQPDDDATPSAEGPAISSKAQVKALMDSEQYRRGDQKTVQAVRAAFKQMSAARARGHEPR